MNRFVEDQNVLAELKKNIDLMSRQLDFLIKNGKPLTALDVDVLMTRTHQIYELVCSAPCVEEQTVVEEVKPVVEKPVEKPIEKPVEKVVEPQPEVVVEKEPEPIVEEEPEPVVEEQVVEQETVEEQPEPVAEEKPVEQPVVEQPKPKKVEKSAHAAPEEQITLADKMAQQEDNTLAARLQRKPIKDLNKAITLQEQFYFADELFGGSMEKYKKSIKMLNEVPTLSGANVCLNELKIELQWSSSSEAYKKLNNLVVRRFDA